ncbi:MAG: Ig-like domain-containing protein [Chitinophagaceae bacterium]|nr:Ig-like domain-containing protein [Chitinophagaceae bacterium]
MNFIKTKISLTTIFSMFLLSAHAQQKLTPQPSKIERNSIDNTPTIISFGTEGGFERPGTHDALYGLFATDLNNIKLVLSSSTTTKNKTLVEQYEEYYHNIKIEMSGVKVLFNTSNRSTFINSNYYNINYPLKTSPEIQITDARDIAITSVGANTFAWQISAMEAQLKTEQKDTSASYFPKGELVYIEDNTLKQQDRKLHLAYKFNVYAIQPLSREDIYVDASNGKILFRNSQIHHTSSSGPSAYSGTVNFNSSKISGTYYLRDSLRGGGINTYTCANTNGSTILDVTSSSPTFASDVALDAHWGAEVVYDYWLNEQGRNSYNNSGGPLNSYVHYLINYNNAFWNGSQMVYGDGSGPPSGFLPLTALDVCAHEIGHGVCQFTANLAYNKESGAMNEGFSDIWAAIIEDYGDPHETDAKSKSMWKIGEEIRATPIRRMDTPNIRFQPDTYGGTYWVSVVGCTPSSSNDYCGVHTNSGVLNHWFYLLCQGGSGTNDIGNAFSVTGVGTSKGADIAYQTELMLTSASDFANCRSASISAAQTLYGSCSPEVEAVTRAWYAVGVGANYTSGSVAAITGTASVCTGATTTLSNSTIGGSWSSSTTSIATVGSSTGVVAGVTAGTSVISYTTSGGCVATRTVTVATSPSVSAISGVSSICSGASTTLTNATASGVWSSSATSVATVGSLTGIVSGATAGTTLISYSITSSCGVTAATKTISVNALPATISGSSTISIGATATFSSATTGGIWTSSAPSVVTIDSATGVVNGISSGSATITYTLPSGCFTTKSVAVTSCSVSFAGLTATCAGKTDTVTASISGGTWTSSNTSVATISSAGVITAIGSGTSTISYITSGGCSGSDVFTVLPSPVAITGSSSVCPGASVTLTNAISGGTWTSSITTIAAVGSGTGVVNGIALGATTISYTLSSGCATTMQFTVGLPGAIAGPGNVCAGDSISLSHPVSGGTWSCSTPSLASINPTTGVLTGIASGMATVSYTVSAGCYVTKTVYVQNLALSMAGTGTVCEAATTTLSCSSTGGAWTSGNPSVATINASTGVLTGVASGTARITYTLVGCYNTRDITVNPVPSSITGIAETCVSGSTTLASATTGGAWTSSNTTRATVGSATGIVSGVSAGTVYITYTAGGCFNTRLVTVGTMPAAITGTNSLCSGSTTTLSSSTIGGTWSSSDTTIATTGPAATSSSATVSGLAVGTSTISYYLAGCSATKTVSVNAGPGAITGNNSICVGGTSTLSASTGGGTWSSSATGIASIGTSGVVTAIATGTATITYRTSSSCYSTRTVSVNSAPAAISGATIACLGYTTTLSHAISGGTWSTSNSAIASVGSGTGIVTGVTTGAANITYTVSPGCFRSIAVNVAATPAAISGSASLCEAAATTLASATSGGTWSSSNTTIATIPTTSGIVTGVSAGTATITYKLSTTGCFAVREVTVNSIPATISGATNICSGIAATFTNTTGGGTWSSSSATIAPIGTASGIITAGTAGAATISYTLTNGCRRTLAITVSALPSAITGVSTICVGNSATLTSASAGLTWSSTNVSVAIVSTASTTTGTVTGIATGSALISYTNAAGCSRVQTVNVSPALPANLGENVVCVGQTVMLSNTTTGGTWVSSAPAKATVGISTGVVTGVAIGTTNVTYALGAGCSSITQITVNAATAAITGTLSVCVGATTALSHVTPGGVWSTSNPAKATVDSATGIVSGISTGTATITYALGGGCFKTTTITIKSSPAAITGASVVIIGATTTLSNATTGGSWSSATPSVASIGSASGLVTGTSVGSSIITYRVTATGCIATRTITVTDSTAGKHSIGDLPTTDIFAVYPNPASDYITIKSHIPGNVTLSTIDGKTVLSQKIESGTNDLNLPVDLPAGVYVIRFYGADSSTQIFKLTINAH